VPLRGEGLPYGNPLKLSSASMAITKVAGCAILRPVLLGDEVYWPSRALRPDTVNRSRMPRDDLQG